MTDYSAYSNEASTTTPDYSRDARVNVLKLLDKSLRDWLRGMIAPFWPDLPVTRLPVVFATPMRAFAEFNRLLGIEDGNQRNVRLPAVSITRTAIRHSLTRAGVGQIVLGYDDVAAPSLLRRAPRPFEADVMYQVDIWARTWNTLNLAVEWLVNETRDHNVKVLTIPYSTLQIGLEDSRVHVIREDIQDNSDLEPGEDSDRVLRHTCDMRMEAWIPQVVTPSEVKIIRSGSMEVLDNTSSPEVTMDSFTVEEED